MKIAVTDQGVVIPRDWFTTTYIISEIVTFFNNITLGEERGNT